MNEHMPPTRLRKRELFRIIIPTAFSFLLFIIVIFFLLFPNFKSHIMLAKKKMIKEMVGLVCDDLAIYDEQVKNGVLSLEQAQKLAKERIRKLRYGPEGKDYFWINDLRGVMIMHPYRKDLEGKNIINDVDPNGKYFMREFVGIARKKGEGYANYMWQWKDDPKRIVPKVSFVKEFKPWGWVVGTGIYIEDAKAEIAKMTKRLVLTSLGVLALIGILMLFVIRETLDIEKEREQVEKALKDSEKQFRKLAEDAPFGLSIMKSDGTFEYFNPQFTRIFGYTIEDIPNKRVWFEKAYPDEALRQQVNLTWETDSHGLNGGDIKERFFPVKCKNGEEKIIHFRNVSLGDGKYLMTYEDITEKANAEKKLRENEEKYRKLYNKSKKAEKLYRSLIQSSADAIIMYDLEGRAEYVSPVFTEIFGWTMDEIKGKRIPFVPDSEKEATMAIINDLVQNGTPCHGFETKRFTKDGYLLEVSISASRYEDHTGKPLGMLVMIRDITERKRLQAQLQQAQKMEAIGTLAGGIAHDFNNLLMGIQGNVSLMLLDMDESHPYFERLKSIEDQIQSGSKLTNQLLGYARQGKYEIEPLDLNEIVKETSETFGRTKKQIMIHHTLADELFAIEGDKSQLEQVLFNIYVNAWQAMPRGGELFIETRNTTHEELKDKVYKVKPGNYVLLSIRDTGVGMDEKTQERIFDPFFTTKEMGHGTGLGLASVYGIVKGHGGYIDVESKKGQGATFLIYLPATSKRVSQKRRSQEIMKKGKETVLLVDDEEHITEIGKELLEAMGFHAIIARNGEEAISLYKQHKDEVDLVLLDMVMPKMGGKEVFNKLREIDPEVKVLLSSGYSLDGEAKEIMSLGCCGFIQKPFRLNDLMEAIKKVLST